MLACKCIFNLSFSSKKIMCACSLTTAVDNYGAVGMRGNFSFVSNGY